MSCAITELGVPCDFKITNNNKYCIFHGEYIINFCIICGTIGNNNFCIKCKGRVFKDAIIPSNPVNKIPKIKYRRL